MKARKTAMIGLAALVSLVHRRKQKHHKLGCDIIFVWSRRFVSS
jgi:hypothetical protein